MATGVRAAVANPYGPGMACTPCSAMFLDGLIITTLGLRGHITVTTVIMGVTVGGLILMSVKTGL